MSDIPITYGRRHNGTMWMSIGNPVKGYHVRADWEFGETYARMLAASEDLLDALKALLDISPMSRVAGDALIHRQAEAAIAKAEGK